MPEIEFLDESQTPARRETASQSKPLPVTGSADKPLPSVGVGGLVSGAVVRPDNATQYAAGEVVAGSTPAPITFANCAREAGGSGYIHSALLIDSASQAAKGQFELWLFDEAPAMDADNAVFTPTNAELLHLVAVVDFTGTPRVGTATVGAGGNCVYSAAVRELFEAAANDRNLYGVLVVRNAYTPVAGELLTAILKISEN